MITVDNILDVSILDTNIDTEQKEKEIKIINLPEGEIDPRLKLLSHSSRTTLHTCPRKYQLYRLSSEEVNIEEAKQEAQNVTFAYGHAVGAGVASVLAGNPEEIYILDTFLEWDADLQSENPKQKKSFWLALFAVTLLADKKERGFLEDWEVVTYNNKPAIELSFIVKLPGGFLYRGYVDAVLQNKHTKEVMVLECKTSSGTANSATYKNSGQAVGYSVILDKLFSDLSSYQVLYLVYETKSYAYKELPFNKSLFQRAIWLQELLIDSEKIELYEQYNTYPMHGESCYNFFRECEYLGLCTLETEHLAKPLTQDIVDKYEEEVDKYDFVVDFKDLIVDQLAKGEVE